MNKLNRNPRRARLCTVPHACRIATGLRVPGVVAAIWVLWFIAFSAAIAQNLSAQEPAKTIIQGVVRDAGGKVVQNASVLLKHQGASGAIGTTTNAEGLFDFTDLAPGTYVLSAEHSGQRSRAMVVVAPSPRGQRPIELTLEDPAGAKSETGSKSAPPIEFADQPNFTIATVTDWTAAGGHGSDAVLRTSEALNRETLKLKLTGADPNAVASTETSKQTEDALRVGLASAPTSSASNHQLGEFYLHAGKFAEAVPLLQAAYRIDPNNAENEYSLAMALKANGEFASARDHVQKLSAKMNTADLHRLSGELDEKLSDPLAAVREFEHAVREDASELNYFEWGSELLLHRAVWQAKDVFSAGAKTFPNSARMLTALGAALFAGALYDDAAQRLCEAADLSPSDAEPYLFLGRIEIAAPNPLPCVEQKLRRFLDQRPQDSLANYFYAMTLLKQHGQATDLQTSKLVENMLTKAVSLDSKCAEAYMQLGVLESARRNYDKAIEYYNKAIEANPQFSEAHYRLGVVYTRVGEKDKAKQEFQLHDEYEKLQKTAVERDRREVKQFLVVVGDKPSAAPPLR